MKIAVVGAGIAGISAAWLLSQSNTVDVYEAEPDLGGHAKTMDVDCQGMTFPVDTGFQVFNRRTYPNLTRFFRHLDIDAADADMSFSVQVKEDGIEWSGTSLDTVFAQRKNIGNPRFLRMLSDVLRLSRESDRLLADPSVAELTLGQLLRREGYSSEFTDWYLIPMGDAIWSTPPGDMLDYPALTFLRFCDNHGLLHILGKPMWLSVPGGSRRYVHAAAASLSGEVFTSEPVDAVRPIATGVEVSTRRRSEAYDAVVLATHPPETRNMLGAHMTDAQRSVLGAFDYWDNDVVLHTDESFMPQSRRAWASWNWSAASGDTGKDALVLTYRINTLQQLPAELKGSILETLNCERMPPADRVLAELTFTHPMFTREAIEAQSRLATIQGIDGIWYAGAWTRYGFHEDGLLAGIRVSEALGAALPWGDELDATRTKVRSGAEVPMLGQTRRLFPGELPPEAEGEALGA